MLDPANTVRLFFTPPNRRRSRSPSGVRLKVTPMRSKVRIRPGASSHIVLMGGWSAR